MNKFKHYFFCIVDRYDIIRAKNYNLTLKSNDFGYEKKAELIEILFKQKFSL